MIRMNGGGAWRLRVPYIYIYRRYKVGVREEDIYRNDGPSIYLFRARTNALGLNDFNRHGREVDERETILPNRQSMTVHSRNLLTRHQGLLTPRDVIPPRTTPSRQRAQIIV